MDECNQVNSVGDSGAKVAWDASEARLTLQQTWLRFSSLIHIICDNNQSKQKKNCSFMSQTQTLKRVSLTLHLNSSLAILAPKPPAEFVWLQLDSSSHKFPLKFGQMSTLFLAYHANREKMCRVGSKYSACFQFEVDPICDPGPKYPDPIYPWLANMLEFFLRP